MWTGRSVLLMGIATAPPRRANRSRWTTSAPERRPLVPTHLGRFHQPVASESQTRRGRTPRWARQGSHPLPAGHRFRCPTPSQPATSGPRRRRRRTRPTIVRRRPSSCHSCRWPPGKQATLHLRGAGHSRTEALPFARVVQRVVPAPVRQSSVHGAAATGSARDDTADGTELHGSARPSRKGAGPDARDAGDARLQPVDIGVGAVARRGRVEPSPRHPQAPPASEEAVAEGRITAS